MCAVGPRCLAVLNLTVCAYDFLHLCRFSHSGLNLQGWVVSAAPWRDSVSRKHASVLFQVLFPRKLSQSMG